MTTSPTARPDGRPAGGGPAPQRPALLPAGAGGVASVARLVPVALLAVVVVVVLAVASSGSGRADSSEAARTRRISQGLRCPVCEGLSVADSPSETARAIVEDVRRRVEEGQTDAEIRAAYVARYDEKILLSPPGSGFSALVWALPAAVLVLAGGGLFLVLRRWRRDPVQIPDDADRALVDQALAARHRAP